MSAALIKVGMLGRTSDRELLAQWPQNGINFFTWLHNSFMLKVAVLGALINAKYLEINKHSLACAVDGVWTVRFRLPCAVIKSVARTERKFP